MGLRDETEYRNPIGAAAVAVRATIRRYAVKLTTRALWQLIGADDDEGEDDVENFSGVGFYARPPDGANAEVILVKVGGSSQHPVIVATRDEETRQAFAVIRDLAADETAMHNSSARVHILKDGTVVVDDGSGAVALATKADADSISSKLLLHTHVYSPGPGGPVPTAVGVFTAGAPTVVGTSVLKGK